MERIIEYAKMLGLPLTRQQCSLFVEYGEILLEYNKVMNLTAITEPGDIALKHFADSIAVIPYLERASKHGMKGMKLADVGTGAGFPGIPLKIARPEIELTLIDSLRKRVGFLEDVTRTLGLENVHLVHARAEDAGNSQALRGSFDAVIARAVAPMPVLCEYCLPLVKTGGFFAAMKSDVKDDLASAEYAISRLGGSVEEFYEYRLPDSDIYRTLIIIRKKLPTPEGYPRKAGIPEKEPLAPGQKNPVKNLPHPRTGTPRGRV
ncbi:MAG: 16S rRNA (guanine(527)-N(7))-methyltransferase RsmG [Saccharofermentanales bacterium]